MRRRARSTGCRSWARCWGKTVTLYDRPLPSALRGLPSIQYRVVRRRLLPRARSADPSGAPPSRTPMPPSGTKARDRQSRDGFSGSWPDGNPIGRILVRQPPDRAAPAGGGAAGVRADAVHGRTESWLDVPLRLVERDARAAPGVRAFRAGLGRDDDDVPSSRVPAGARATWPPPSATGFARWTPTSRPRAS
jgi:hypothetical protein